MITQSKETTDRMEFEKWAESQGFSSDDLNGPLHELFGCWKASRAELVIENARLKGGVADYILLKDATISMAGKQINDLQVALAATKERESKLREIVSTLETKYSLNSEIRELCCPPPADDSPIPNIVCGVCDDTKTITDTEGCEWPCYQCNPQPQNNQLLVNAARYQWIMSNQREAVEVIEQMGICKLEQHIDDDIARMKNGN